MCNAGACVMAIGVWALLYFGSSFQGFVISVYYILFGIMIIFLEFVFPKRITPFIGFYFHFMGRGLFFIFLGCLLFFGGKKFHLYASILIFCVGALYVVMACLTMTGTATIYIPPPWCAGSGSDVASASAPSRSSSGSKSGGTGRGTGSQVRKENAKTKLSP